MKIERTITLWSKKRIKSIKIINFTVFVIICEHVCVCSPVNVILQSYTVIDTWIHIKYSSSWSKFIWIFAAVVFIIFQSYIATMMN